MVGQPLALRAMREKMAKEKKCVNREKKHPPSKPRACDFLLTNADCSEACHIGDYRVVRPSSAREKERSRGKRRERGRDLGAAACAGKQKTVLAGK